MVFGICKFFERIVFGIWKFLGFKEKEDVCDHELLCNDINLKEDYDNDDIIANDDESTDE